MEATLFFGYDRELDQYEELNSIRFHAAEQLTFLHAASADGACQAPPLLLPQDCECIPPSPLLPAIWDEAPPCHPHRRGLCSSVFLLCEEHLTTMRASESILGVSTAASGYDLRHALAVSLHVVFTWVS